MTIASFWSNVRAPFDILNEGRKQAALQESINARKAEVASVQTKRALRPLLFVGAALIAVILWKKFGRKL